MQTPREQPKPNTWLITLFRDWKKLPNHAFNCFEFFRVTINLRPTHINARWIIDTHYLPSFLQLYLRTFGYCIKDSVSVFNITSSTFIRIYNTSSLVSDTLFLGLRWTLSTFLKSIEINITELRDAISRLNSNMPVHLFACVHFCYLVRYVKIPTHKAFLIIAFAKLN